MNYFPIQYPNRTSLRQDGTGAGAQQDRSDDLEWHLHSHPTQPHLKNVITRDAEFPIAILEVLGHLMRRSTLGYLGSRDACPRHAHSPKPQTYGVTRGTIVQVASRDPRY